LFVTLKHGVPDYGSILLGAEDDADFGSLTPRKKIRA
jgi:hypothetical protein